jgi:hypothetical protein
MRNKNSVEKGANLMRLSTNQMRDGKLWNGYDYELQAWVLAGVYQDCGHTDALRLEWGGQCCAAHELAGKRVA